MLTVIVAVVPLVTTALQVSTTDCTFPPTSTSKSRATPEVTASEKGTDPSKRLLIFHFKF